MTIPVAALDAGGKAVAWLWDKYGKALADKAAENLKKKWTEVQWVEAAQKYRARMLELHGTLRVIGKPQPVSLEGVFTDIFILDRPRAFRRFDIARLREDPDLLPSWQTKRIPGLRMVTQPEAHRLSILGLPGAGKTTFLKYLTLQAAQGKLDKTPIFVGLNEWNESGLELLPFIARQFEICTFPDARAFIEHILEEGDALILFDGLDEVRQEADQRAKVIGLIRDFSNQYAKSQVLVTCRVAATEYELSDKFTYVELADFTEDQMRAYARKWFNDDIKKGRAFEAEFFDKEELRGLREMGCTPLLLALLCLHFEETQTFPQHRVELYEEALDALLKRWDATRNIRRDETYRKLSLGRKRELLATLAAETFEKGETFFAQEDLEKRIVAYLCTLPPADINEDIDGEVILKVIEAQHGILVERAHRIHTFAHLSFQEYFTAKYAVERNTLACLLTTEHIRDRRWREVLLNTASLLYEADDFFDCFIRVLDVSAQNNTALLALLRWADMKAWYFSDLYKISALRAFYIYLCLDLALARAFAHALSYPRALALTRALAFDRDRDLDRVLARTRAQIIDRDRDRDRHDRGFDLDLDLDQAHTRTLALARTLAFGLDLALALDSGPALDLALTRASTRASACARGLVHDLDHDLDLDFAHNPDLDRYRYSDHIPPRELIVDACLVDVIYFASIYSSTYHIESMAEQLPRFTYYLQGIRALAQQAQMPALVEALSCLKVPSPDAPQAVWEMFMRSTEALLVHRDLHHHFSLSNILNERLEECLQACQLLVECLNLARVSDRAGIEARILQPPEIADNELENE